MIAVGLAADVNEGLGQLDELVARNRPSAGPPSGNGNPVEETAMDYKLEVVVIPVSDVDRAKAFYVDQVGFPVDVDHQPNEHFRVVQMTPRGSGCSVTIGTGLGNMTPGSLEGLQLCVGDIEAAHADLASRGVPVSSVQHHDGSGFVDGPGGDYNSFFFFHDPDGNSWAVQQSPLVRAAEAAAGS